MKTSSAARKSIIAGVLFLLSFLLTAAYPIREVAGQSDEIAIVTAASVRDARREDGRAIAGMSGGLTAAEQASIDRQYQFEVRGKERILDPYIYASGRDTSDGELTSRRVGEDERLYRYFGTAMDLYDQGRFDEAAEILEYISMTRPEDEYVKNILKQVKGHKRREKRSWDRRIGGNSGRLRRNMIKDLLKEGKGYYRQKRYDKALLRFADVLASDPKNSVAERYMKKLEDFYLKRIRARDLAEGYSSEEGYDMFEEQESPVRGTEVEPRGRSGSIHSGDSRDEKLRKKADDILAEEEQKLRDRAAGLLDQEELEGLITKKRVRSMLDKAELGITVEEVILDVRKKERKRDLYTLGPGDVIQVSVRDHPELSGKGAVRLSGEFILPLVYDVVFIDGLTLDEATEKISETMKRYVTDPFVTVTIEDYKSKIFYVIDELGARPYPITSPGLTLRDALLIADWGTDRALGRVVVTKPDKIHPITKTVDAYDMIYRGNLANNIRIEDGDVIYIPLTIAAKTTEVISSTLRPFAAVRQARDDWFYLKGDRRGYGDMTRMKDEMEKPPWLAGTVSVN
ncbi:MAG: polysaccharide biosynthesis/export family protein [Candidatus Omnitrophota bacterium]